MTESRFSTPRLRATHRDALTEILNAKLRLQTTKTWMAVLPHQRIPCGPILNLHQVFADPQVHHNRMLLEHDHPRAGHRRLLALPLKLSEAPTAIRLAPPALGEHTEEILAGLGYSAALIEQFRHDGIL